MALSNRTFSPATNPTGIRRNAPQSGRIYATNVISSSPAGVCAHNRKTRSHGKPAPDIFARIRRAPKPQSQLLATFSVDMLKRWNTCSQRRHILWAEFCVIMRFVCASVYVVWQNFSLSVPVTPSLVSVFFTWSASPFAFPMWMSWRKKRGLCAADCTHRYSMCERVSPIHTYGRKKLPIFVGDRFNSTLSWLLQRARSSSLGDTSKNPKPWIQSSASVHTHTHIKCKSNGASLRMAHHAQYWNGSQRYG